MKLMEQLGGVKCKSCASNDYKILELDHINNDGMIDRKRFKNGDLKMIPYYLAHVKEARRKLQVLCAPCHRSKHGEFKKKKNWAVVYTI